MTRNEEIIELIEEHFESHTEMTIDEWEEILKKVGT
ncbi:hypothetical protein ES705_09369 [subsurface metagenome]